MKVSDEFTSFQLAAPSKKTIPVTPNPHTHAVKIALTIGTNITVRVLLMKEPAVFATATAILI